jgi:L-ascorbate metabolism protein UlaG (beta-lactamase superfamily)
MRLTRIDLNSWLLVLGQQRILIDPWLVDPLVFLGVPWFLQVVHRNPIAYTPQTLPPLDLIVISQAQPDHCHVPTLRQLAKTIPVVASPAAGTLIRSLGFATVHIVQPWQSVQLRDLQITAVPGAQLGPTLENGYVFADPVGGVLYYEPHRVTPQCQQQVAEQTQVDVLLIPVVGQIFPLLGEVIMGPEKALATVRRIQPHTIVPTALGDVCYSGLLARAIQSVGSLEEFDQRLRQSGLASRLIAPAPGETLVLESKHLKRG